MSVRIARRGAIAASRVQAPATVTAVTFNGTTSNYGSTPDTAANSVTDDIDIRAKLSMADWSPAAEQPFIAKWGLSNGTRSYLFLQSSTPRLQFIWSTDGTGVQSVTATADAGLTDGTVNWVRVTRVKVTGVVTFYKSTDGTSWTQVGNTAVSAANSPIANTASIVEAGSYGSGVVALNGTLHKAQILNGIDGTIVATFDPSTVTIIGTRNPTSFVASTGETWTMNGSAWNWATV